MINNCPVCNSKDFEVSLEINNVPVFQNMLYSNYEEAVHCPKADISICLCKECGFLFNRSFETEKLKYNKDYDIRQETSERFQTHLKNVIELIHENCRLDNKTILEVGCGKGFFLNLVAESYQCNCIGFDPSYIDYKRESENIKFIQRYFTEEEVEHLDKKPDIIVIRHVIEHLQNPLDMLIMLAKTLSEQGFIYIETPSYQWIIENNTIFDYTYEHCSYFSDDFIRILLNMAGLEVVLLTHSFEGQYLSVIAKKSNNKKVPRYLYSAQDKNKFYNIKLKIQKYLSEESAKRNICLWGAAGKGAMFCNLFDFHKKYIKGAIDINEKKQGAFISGTGHPIWAPSRLTEKEIGLVIVVNSNYFDEIRSMIYEINPEICAVDIQKILMEL